MGNQISQCHDGVYYPPSMRKVEVLSVSFLFKNTGCNMLTETKLHGQTGQTCRSFTQAQPPVTTTRTSTPPNAVMSITKRLEHIKLPDQTNTQAESPVTKNGTSTATNAVLPVTKRLDQTMPHGQTNTQAESPDATTKTAYATHAISSTTELLERAQLHDQASTQAESPAATVSTTPAADDVLSTTELLEQILSHFDIKELVTLRRVSRHWSDVMAKSPVLQRAMFLAPEPELPFEWHLEHGSYGELHVYTKERFWSMALTGSLMCIPKNDSAPGWSRTSLA